jgi:hypothetical protein
MSEARQDLEDGAGGDALLRALFNEATRPPMGDHAFVGAVMADVAAEERQKHAHASWLAGSIGALGVVVLAPSLGPIVGRLADAYAPMAQYAPMLSGGLGTLLLAAAASAAAWMYAERA